MQIIGHRGSPSDSTPENTLAAVEAALAAGADGVEVDVRLTADGIPVCCHDPGLQRVAGVARGVRSLTYDDLTAIRVDGHPVPTVVEVMRLVAGRGSLVLDLKPEQRPLSLVRALGVALADTALAHELDLVLSSTQAPILDACEGLLPHVRRALIVGDAETPSRCLAQAVRRGDQALHVQMRALFAAPDLVRAAHGHGLAVRAWTVNRGVDARLLRLLEVDAAITDVPRLLRTALRPEPVDLPA